MAGTYQEDTGAFDCDICPDRHYCEEAAAEAVDCPAGFFCPEGTEFATEFPCPSGTYSNETRLAAASECPLCPPGRSVLLWGLLGWRWCCADGGIGLAIPLISAFGPWFKGSTLLVLYRVAVCVVNEKRFNSRVRTAIV